MKKFGEILRELRLEKGLKQIELAKILHVKDNTVSAWERGTNEPNQETLIALASFFNVTTDYLLGLEI